MFEVVSRPGKEEYFRQAGNGMFDLFDLNQDGFINIGFISIDEFKVRLHGSPWTIVAFSSVVEKTLMEKCQGRSLYMGTWTSGSTLRMIQTQASISGHH